MIAFKLAIRNLLGAGLRTWLNVIVLSITFIFILMIHGFIEGWNRQAMNDMKEWEIGGGQYWHTEYDPHDPFTLEDSHRDIPESVLNETLKVNYCPVLISQATIYPQGRMRNILMKGIDPDQQVLELPTSSLKGDYDEIPVIIGKGNKAWKGRYYNDKMEGCKRYIRCYRNSYCRYFQNKRSNCRCSTGMDATFNYAGNNRNAQ